MTTARIKRPLVMMRALLAETTEAMMRTMAVVETRGSAFTAFSVCLLKKWFTTKPRTIGSRTTFTTDHIMLRKLTSTVRPA